MRLKALYAPTPQLTIKGLIEVHRNEAGASNIVNQQPFEDGTFLQAVFRNGKTGSYDDYDLYNLTVAYDLGFAELLSSTSYNRADSDQSFTQLIGTEPVPLLEVLISDWFLDSSIASRQFQQRSRSVSIGFPCRGDEQT